MSATVHGMQIGPLFNAERTSDSEEREPVEARGRADGHLYLSGVVRPYDIDMANTVSSSRVLDARIDFSGRGVVSDKQGPGMLHRGMDTVWPF